MINNTISTILVASVLNLNVLGGVVVSTFDAQAGAAALEDSQPAQQVLSSRAFSLEDRYNVKSVSDVFKDNILLTIARMKGSATGSSVNWDEVRKPFSYSFVLQPGETFAFHDTVLPEYQGKITKTTNSHFNGAEGFESDGYLMGDGVCHLASLISWAAKDAELNVKAPTNHDFAVINEVPKEQGVAIYADPSAPGASALQNLYITNNKSSAVTFKFDFDGTNLKVTVLQ